MEGQGGGERLAVLDFEASGLDDDLTYPIEVAVVRDDGEARSWLISPTDEWLDTGTWSDDSAEVHGLNLDLLQREGAPVEEVVQALVEFTEGYTVLSDARYADGFWLRRLFAAAFRKPPFQLECYWAACHAVLNSVHDVGWPGEGGIPPHRLTEEALEEARRRIPEEHRAMPDARRLMEAIRILRVGSGAAL